MSKETIRRGKSVFWKTCSILLLIAISTFIRLHHLDYESLWMDELLQVSSYPHTIKDIIQDAAFQSQPPLDYFIGHFVYMVSKSDFAVRLPAAIFGVCTVMLLTMIIADICSWNIALGSGFVAAIIPFNIYFSQEARPYSIAIFLFLCVIWWINRLFKRNRFDFYHMMVLLLFATLFLNARALSPLIVIISFIILLSIHSILDLRRSGFVNTPFQKVVWGIVVTFTCAIIFTIPSYKIILAHSVSYVAENSLTINLEDLRRFFANISFRPIWQAFSVQTEPLTSFFIVLLLMVPFYFWKLKRWRENSILIVCTELFVLASFMHICLFRMKTNYVFRPPYAIYLLPLTIIISAASFQEIWNGVQSLKNKKLLKKLILIPAFTMIFLTMKSGYDCKKVLRKSDWKGIGEYISDSYTTKQVLLFDALSKYNKWEPTYFGFPRYYHKKNGPLLMSMKRLAFIDRNSTKLKKEPILLLFQWREYKLTHSSRYSILPIPNSAPKHINYHQIQKNELFYTKQFTGFILIRLKKTSGNFIEDTYTLVSNILMCLPDNSSTVELCLAAGRLATLIQNGKAIFYFNKAVNLTEMRNREKVKRIITLIKRY